PSHLFHLFHLISLHLCLSFSFFFLALLLVIHSLITPCSTASLIAELSFSPHITLTPSFSCPHPLSFLHHLPRSHLSSPSLSLSLLLSLFSGLLCSALLNGGLLRECSI